MRGSATKAGARTQLQGPGERDNNVRGVIALVVLVVGIGVAATTENPAQQAAGLARIIRGPNIRVSQDGEFPHVELMVAANPLRAGNLIGAAITVGASGKLGVTRASKAYASIDGGNTWMDAAFPEQREYGGGDPVVAFGASGTAYFAALDFAPVNGQQRIWLRVYRSEDGGMTWGKPTTLGYSYDRPQLAVDRTEGGHSGRVYIGVTYRRNGVSKVGLFYSDDDARTFSGPVEVVSGHGGWDVQAGNVLVLSDGSVLVSYGEYQRPEVTKEGMKLGPVAQPMKLVLSKDGARTFIGPYQIGVHTVDSATVWGQIQLMEPMYAVDESHSRFRDHLYVAWMDTRFGRPRILFARSLDRGVTWSDPMMVDATAPAWAAQYHPAITVNNAGIVGIAWFDTRASRDSVRYDEYFTASTDGGERFLPSSRISTESSAPQGQGNLAPVVQSWRLRGRDSIALEIAAATAGFRNGGDYMGLAADPQGVFHPFWADSRSGTFQAFTASVRVETGMNEKSAMRAHTPGVSRSDEPRDVTHLLDIVADPGRVDAARRLMIVELRLRNRSDTAVYGPVHLKLLGPDEFHREFAPVIVGGAEEEGPGKAEVDFTNALGGGGVLLPGAISDVVEVRLQFADPLRLPLLKARVTGVIEQHE